MTTSAPKIHPTRRLFDSHSGVMFSRRRFWYGSNRQALRIGGCLPLSWRTIVSSARAHGFKPAVLFNISVALPS